jgi:hypothetical protein
MLTYVAAHGSAFNLILSSNIIYRAEHKVRAIQLILEQQLSLIPIVLNSQLYDTGGLQYVEVLSIQTKKLPGADLEILPISCLQLLQESQNIFLKAASNPHLLSISENPNP